MRDEMEETLQVDQELSAKQAYFASLAEWTKQASLAQEAMSGFPEYLLANYPQLFLPQIGGQRLGTLGHIQPNPGSGLPERARGRGLRRARRFEARRRVLSGYEQQAIIERLGGYEFALATLWKRFVAQALDMVFLILLKMILAYGILGQVVKIEKGLFWLVLEDDMVMYFFGISTSTEALFVRSVLKLVGFCYEPLWTGYCNGATPGKWLMGIRIRTAQAVVLLHNVNEPDNGGPQRVLLYPARRLSMRRALARALTKHFVTTIILPMSVRFVFRHNRTEYDKWTNTIVVEASSNVVYHPGIGGRDQR